MLADNAKATQKLELNIGARLIYSLDIAPTDYWLQYYPDEPFIDSDTSAHLFFSSLQRTHLSQRKYQTIVCSMATTPTALSDW